MEKKHLIKLGIFFALSFIIILTLMTIIVGAFRGSSGQTLKSDSLQTSGTDTLSQADSEAVIEKDSTSKILQQVDSLREELEKYRSMNLKLEKELRAAKELLAESKKSPEPQNTKTMAKIYENMAAEEAAQILAGLQNDLAAEIISNMKKRQAAKILAQMEPSIALSISKKLVSMN
ncbi:MAG: hypothetical protein Kow0042_03180 [Calditrichia bacterium]